MKLAKAIEIGNDLLTELPQFSPDDRREAIKLLIEAGGQLQAIRQAHPEFRTFILPGETEEYKE